MFCGGWFNARFGLSGEINSIPVDDLARHDAGPSCWCRPEVTEDDVVVHRALDGREDFEEGRRKPS